MWIHIFVWIILYALSLTRMNANCWLWFAVYFPVMASIQNNFFGSHSKHSVFGTQSVKKKSSPGIWWLLCANYIFVSFWLTFPTQNRHFSKEKELKEKITISLSCARIVFHLTFHIEKEYRIFTIFKEHSAMMEGTRREGETKYRLKKEWMKSAIKVYFWMFRVS